MTPDKILTDAMRRIQGGEKLTYTDKEVELIMLGWQAEFDKANAARIAAQQRLADMQELAAKAGLSHMKTVQEAVAEAVAAEREACEERVASLFEVLETPYLPDITRAIRARGTP